MNQNLIEVMDIQPTKWLGPNRGKGKSLFEKWDNILEKSLTPTERKERIDYEEKCVLVKSVTHLVDESTPLEYAANESLEEMTRSILGSLTPREAEILKSRYGIGSNTQHSLREIGKMFDVGPERIRQIEAKALRKLRHPSRSEYLKELFDEQ